MKTLLFIFLTIPLLLLGQNSKNNQELELEKLNEFLFTEYVLNKNTEPLNQIATDNFTLIAAPGMIETKQQAIDGVDNLNISSIDVIVNKTSITENTGIVIGILAMKGTIMNRPVPGKIRYSSTFVKINNKWRLMARTMTPLRVK